MNSQTFVVVLVMDLLGLTVVRPWTLDHAHLAPGDAHSVRALGLDAPFPVGQLTL